MDLKKKTIIKNPQDKSLLLSEAEKEILRHIKIGLTSAEISEIRNCSSRTVEKHRSNIIKKLGLKSSPNALLFWILENDENTGT